MGFVGREKVGAGRRDGDIGEGMYLDKMDADGGLQLSVPIFMFYDDGEYVVKTMGEVRWPRSLYGVSLTWC